MLIRNLAKYLAMAFLTISLFSGCGSDMQPIEGEITLDGNPLAGVQILFDQPGATGGKSFAGRTDDNGRFILSPVGSDEVSDVEGKYRVSLTTAVADRDATEHTPLPKELIPKRYRNGALDFEVPPGGTSEANFELTTRK